MASWVTEKRLDQGNHGGRRERRKKRKQERCEDKYPSPDVDGSARWMLDEATPASCSCSLAALFPANSQEQHCQQGTAAAASSPSLLPSYPPSLRLMPDGEADTKRQERIVLLRLGRLGRSERRCLIENKMERKIVEGKRERDYEQVGLNTVSHKGLSEPKEVVVVLLLVVVVVVVWWWWWWGQAYE